MIKDYKTIREISGPLMIVKNVEGVTYDELCRKAINAGADMNKLIKIEARDRIGRAKSVPAETYAEEYSRIADDMAAQIKEASHD